MSVIDPQDPLPEGKWIWRRLFIWLLTIAACACIWWIVPRINGQAELVDVIKWLIGAIIILATYYLIAPSAEHIVRLVQGGRSARAGMVERAAEMVAPAILRQGPTRRDDQGEM